MAKYVIKVFKIVFGKGIIKRTKQRGLFSSFEFELLVLESQKNCSADEREEQVKTKH